MQTIRFYNEFHLGDQLYQLHFYRKLVDAHPDFTIINYCDPQFFEGCRPFLKGYEDKILLEPLGGHSGAINGWIGDNSFIWNTFARVGWFYDLMYYEWYIQLSARIGVENPIKTLEDTLFDMSDLLQPTPLAGEVDILLGNHACNSGQWYSDRREFNRFIDRFSGRFRMVSTAPTGDSRVPCTLDWGLNLVQVGNLAINSCYIIGVHSAPYCTFINRYNYDKTKFVVCHNQGINYQVAKDSKNLRTLEEFELFVSSL